MFIKTRIRLKVFIYLAFVDFHRFRDLLSTRAKIFESARLYYGIKWIIKLATWTHFFCVVRRCPTLRQLLDRGWGAAPRRELWTGAGITHPTERRFH